MVWVWVLGFGFFRFFRFVYLGGIEVGEIVGRLRWIKFRLIDD